MVKYKLNNKGITTIEVIISFVIVVILVSSLYSTISSFNEKRLIESYKSKVLTYKDSLTKKIQDDFTKIGISSATYSKEIVSSAYVYQVDCSMKDGTARRLIITQRYTKSDTHPNGDPDNNDYFMIEYGQPDLTKNETKDQNANLIEYPIPDLGESKAKNTSSTSSGDKTYYAKDLVISNVIISLGNDNIKQNSNILSIYIGFYHPELSTKYSINIVSPINYKKAIKSDITQINNTKDNDVTTSDDLFYKKILANESVNLKSGNPDFSKIAATKGESGMYTANDDFGTSYYYRGIVDNNWVSFAGFYWRIIRINGDNSVRMIYSGTEKNHTGVYTQIGTSAFNPAENVLDRRTSVNYMYNNGTISSYNDSIVHNTDSTIKKKVDTWYNDNIKNLYDNYIADEIYCGDADVDDTTADIWSSNAYGTHITYESGKRIYYTHNPQLTCTNINDSYTKNSQRGNNKLTYPVGLITADEVMFAGALGAWENNANTKYYLYTGQKYWTMTPSDLNSNDSSRWSGVAVIRSDGSLNGEVVNVNEAGIRPVISLGSWVALSSGTGKEGDPYVIS